MTKRPFVAYVLAICDKSNVYDIDDSHFVAQLRLNIWTDIKDSLPAGTTARQLRLYDATQMSDGDVSADKAERHVQGLKERAIKEGEVEGNDKGAHLDSGRTLESCFEERYW